MATIQPSTGRASIEHLGLETIISIPTRKKPFVLIFLPIWLVFWVFGFLGATSQLGNTEASEPQYFMLLWLTMWSIGGLAAILIFLWNAFGIERVILSTSYLKHQRSLFGLKTERTYDRSRITDIRVSPDFDQPKSFFGNWHHGSKYWGWSGGVIAFDYGAKTFRCAMGIDEAEARQILEQLGLKRRT